MSEEKTILTTKLSVPLAGLVTVGIGVLALLVSGVFWASNVAAQSANNTKELESVQGDIEKLQDRDAAASTRITIIETNYQQILSNISEVKTSLNKIEDKFNLK